MVRVAANLVIIFLLVSAGVHLWYGRLEKKLLAGTPKPVAARPDHAVSAGRPGPAAVEPKHKADDFKIIVSRNIFQAVLETVVEEPEEIVEEVVPTSLNLTLLGTVTGNNRDARAIIVDNKGKQQDLYQIGDAIQGAFIESIERGKVTFDVNGRKEALVIKDREGGGPGPPKVPASASRIAPKSTGAARAAARKIPRTSRPHRRISFRQDPQQTGMPPEILNGEESAVDIEEPVEPEETVETLDAVDLDQGPELPADSAGGEELLPVE